ncbi:MAG: guanylate kinase [Clostridia bacterium]|jgi:guanylate kinase|nr:guanylate kinase [Clostridia bacterium]MBR3095322.1 guanylate kinase [Clostridia bacterium]
MRNEGLLIVLSGPSGSGKDTIISRVLDALGDEGFLSVSMTTRPRRGTEVDGVDYYFVTPEQFRENVENDLMLEYAQYGANFYGTPVGPVRHLLAQGKTVILNIEVQGGKNVRRLIPEAIEIFVAPPSLQELERRLIKRGTETRDAIDRRLLIAQAELQCAADYDYIVINDVLEDAVDDVLAIIRASRLKSELSISRIREVMNHVES